MPQQIRSNKLLSAATIEKLLSNITQSTTVPIVRANGLLSALDLSKLLSITILNVPQAGWVDEFGAVWGDETGVWSDE